MAIPDPHDLNFPYPYYKPETWKQQIVISHKYARARAVWGALDTLQCPCYNSAIFVALRKWGRPTFRFIWVRQWQFARRGWHFVAHFHAYSPIIESEHGKGEMARCANWSMAASMG